MLGKLNKGGLVRWSILIFFLKLQHESKHRLCLKLGYGLGRTPGPRVRSVGPKNINLKINIDKEKEIRVIVPGRTYRSDHDATHSPMFHQCEGLVIGKEINMSHLKGTLIEFLKVFFNSSDLSVRFRPSFFPFTEPSAEVDIGYKKLSDGTLDIGQGDKWLEVLGSGMVHPKVLEGVGIDPNKYQGFAFGMGLERLTMLKYNIPDLRPFYDSDLRWLKHYGFLGINEINLHSGLNGVFS